MTFGEFTSKIPLRLIGLLQFLAFLLLLYIASFGGLLLGFIPPALLIGGKGAANMFTSQK